MPHVDATASPDHGRLGDPATTDEAINGLPQVVTGHGFEYRLWELDGTTVALVRLPAGADLTPAFAGFPDSLCPCPHWGYVVGGRLRLHTVEGPADFVAGEVFAVEAGHVPQALEDCEYVEVSRTADLTPVVRHIVAASAGSGAAKEPRP